jgi:hypothetical protein
MNKDEISKNNRLVVGFMNGNIKNTDFYGDFNQCKYNSSWDLLMPVVEKIESIKDDYHGRFQVFINSNQCIIQSINIFKKRKNDYYFNEYTLGSKIESTYMAVVKFIEWYNKQTKHE